MLKVVNFCRTYVLLCEKSSVNLVEEFSEANVNTESIKFTYKGEE